MSNQQKMENPTGACKKPALRVIFDSHLKLEFHGSKITQHSMAALMRQSIFSLLAGYEDTNDAERLSVDSTMRHVVGGRARNTRREISGKDTIL